MANALPSGYTKRKYRGFVSNDALKENWAKLITFKEAGTDGDGEVDTNTHNLDNFNDCRLANVAEVFQEEWSPYGSNPILSPEGTEDNIAFGSVLKVDSTYYYYYCYYDASDIWQIGRATSNDGKSWTKDSGNNPVFTKGANGKFDEQKVWCPIVWKESTTWYMLYTGRNSSGHEAVGYATSANGTSWTRQNSGDAVISGTASAWDENSVECWGLIKVGSTYYLWYSTLLTPREVGLATSANLTSWSKDGANPLFTSGRYCVAPFKRGSYYYLLVTRYTSGTDYSEFELYRDSNPTFHSADRTFIRSVKTCGASGWDSKDEDTPYVLTDDIEKDTYSASGSELWMYYSGQEGSTWKFGMTIESDIDDALAIGSLFQKEWNDTGALSSGVSAEKWFKVTKAYSSVLTSNAASGQKVVNVNDASELAAGNWLVIARDDGTDELVQIASIATNAITMETNLVNAYTTADNAKVMLAYYVYYNNATENSHQDGDKVFTQLEDFEWGSDGDPITDDGGTVDWTQDTGNVDISTGQKFGGTRACKLIGDNAAAPKCSLAQANSNNIAIRMRYYKEDASRLVINHGDGTTLLESQLQADEDVVVYDGAAYVDTTKNAKIDEWGLLEFNNFDWTAKTVDVVIDGVTAAGCDFSWANATQNDRIRISGLNSTGADTWIDDFIIRKYPDLVGSGFGAEESVINIDITTSLLTADIASLVPAFVLDMKPVASLLTANLAMLAPTMGIDRIFTTSLLTADIAMLAPLVGIGTEIDVTLLTADIASLVPTITTIKSPNISMTLLTADLAMLAPDFVLDRKIDTTLLTADLAMLAPALSLGINISATLLTADIVSLVPTFVLDRKPVMTLLAANAAMLNPTFVLDRKFDVSLMAADIAMLIPEVSIGVIIAVSLLTGEIVMLIPSVDISGKPFEGIAYNIKKIEGIGYNVKKIEGIRGG